MKIHHGVFIPGKDFYARTFVDGALTPIHKLGMPKQLAEFVYKRSNLYERFKKVCEVPYGDAFKEGTVTKNVRRVLKQYAELVEFTMIIDDEYAVIAVVHPKDNFCRKEGVRVCKSKIEAAKNDPDAIHKTVVKL